MKSFLNACAFFACIQINAQTSTDYSDVAVIVNDNSFISLSIGSYFQQARNIPEINMIHVNVPTIEIIDSLQYEEFRLQVENYLLANNLSSSINYLVTTKGMPVRVERASCVYLPAPSIPMNCSTVESELSLMLSANAAQVGLTGSVDNPYYGESSNFSRAAYDIYLVTRLDGYTYEDVTNLIDNSGPNRDVNILSNRFVFDVVGTSLDTVYYNQLNNNAAAALQANAWNTVVHPDPLQLNDEELVLGYVRTEIEEYLSPMNYSWIPGSIATDIDMNFSYSSEVTNGIEANSIPDLINKGLTGGHTYAYTLFFGLVLDQTQLFSAYTDGSFNLAESYYQSLRRLSHVDIVIGDPKTSIIAGNTASLPPLENGAITVGPNPSSGSLTIYPSGEEIESLRMLNELGQVVHSSHASFTQTTTFDFTHLGTGVYYLEMKSASGIQRTKFILTR